MCTERRANEVRGSEGRARGRTADWTDVSGVVLGWTKLEGEGLPCLGFSLGRGLRIKASRKGAVGRSPKNGRPVLLVPLWKPTWLVLSAAAPPAPPAGALRAETAAPERRPAGDVDGEAPRLSPAPGAPSPPADCSSAAVACLRRVCGVGEREGDCDWDARRAPPAAGAPADGRRVGERLSRAVAGRVASGAEALLPPEKGSRADAGRFLLSSTEACAADPTLLRFARFLGEVPPADASELAAPSAAAAFSSRVDCAPRGVLRGLA